MERAEDSASSGGARDLTALQGEGQWIGRPWAARGVRAFVLLVPFGASVAFAWMLSTMLPTVSTVPSAIVRWLLIAIVSTSVTVAPSRFTFDQP